MKIPKMYISFIDWKDKYIKRDTWSLKLEKDKDVLELQKQNIMIQNQGLWDEIHKLKAELKKAKYVTEGDKVRDTITGRYVSKTNITTEQLKRERADRAYKSTKEYTDEQPSDNCAVGHYNLIKKASKI